MATDVACGKYGVPLLLLLEAEGGGSDGATTMMALLGLSLVLLLDEEAKGMKVWVV